MELEVLLLLNKLFMQKKNMGRDWTGRRVRFNYSSSESTFLRASLSDLPSLNPCSDYLCTHATIYSCCQAKNELRGATKKQQLRPSLGTFSKLSLVQLSCSQQEWDLLNSQDLRSNFNMSSVITTTTTSLGGGCQVGAVYGRRLHGAVFWPGLLPVGEIWGQARKSHGMLNIIVSLGQHFSRSPFHFH